MQASAKLLGVLAVSSLTLVSCYIDDLKDRAPIPVTAADSSRADVNGNHECRATLSKGCFDGHVLSETQFWIEGQEFFNADDLAIPARFMELVTIQKDGKTLKAGQDFTVQLVTPLDRASFAQGFEYVLDGDYFRRGKIRADGDFSINDLAQGSYDLRVQKGIKFLVIEKAVAVAPAQSGSPSPVPSPTPSEAVAPASGREISVADSAATPAPAATLAKQFCATIYSDTQLDVTRNRSTFEKFDNFKMYVTDNECADSGAGTTLTL